MPYYKDIRCGEGWFTINVSSFDTYLEETMKEDLIVNDNFLESEVTYHYTCVGEEVETRVNEYIRWRVFGEKRSQLDEMDLLPEEFEPHYSSRHTGERVWAYVYYHVKRFVERKPLWYSIREHGTEDHDDDQI